MFNFDISVLVNSIGLVFDVLGAILIYKNTPKVSFDNFLYDTEVYEKMRITARKMNKRVRVGTLFLFTGFLIQLISNWI
jgi:hypothetical protein